MLVTLRLIYLVFCQGGAQSPFPQVRRGVEVVGLSVGESAWFGVGVRAATPAGLLCVVELR